MEKDESGVDIIAAATIKLGLFKDHDPPLIILELSPDITVGMPYHEAENFSNVLLELLYELQPPTSKA